MIHEEGGTLPQHFSGELVLTHHDCRCRVQSVIVESTSSFIENSDEKMWHENELKQYIYLKNHFLTTFITILSLIFTL